MDQKYRLADGRVVTPYEYGREFIDHMHKLNKEVNPSPDEMSREELEEIGEDLLQDMINTGEVSPVRPDGDF